MAARNIAIVGHKGAGKTSLGEAILFVAKATTKIGRVAEQTSILDDTPEEKEHACTLELSPFHVLWKGSDINFIDTPGEGSFLSETRLAMAAVDSVILVVSARDGVQPVTERVFAWAREAQLPCFVVITKADADNATAATVIAEIRARLKAQTTVLQACVGEGAQHRGVVDLVNRLAWVDGHETPSPDFRRPTTDIAVTIDSARAKLVEDVAASRDDLTDQYLIAYKETVTRTIVGIEGKHKKQTGGHGQFGVCYIDVAPLPRGSGFVFEDAIVGGAIPRQFIPAVEKGITKAMTRGCLAGFPMVDLRVRLFDGKYHDVDSSDASFQVAASKAFRAAVAKAGPVLLEPIVKLQVSVPNGATGDVIGDINSRRGRILGTDNVDDLTIVNAHVPLAEILEYESKLKSLTQGKGVFHMAVERLEICPPHVQETVIRESGFRTDVEDE